MEQIITAEQLADALSDMLDAWNYNLGADRFARVNKAIEVLRRYREQTGEPQSAKSSKP